RRHLRGWTGGETGGGDAPFGEVLVTHVGDVEAPDPGRAGGGVEKFPPLLQREDFPAVVVPGFGEFEVALLVLLVVGGVGEFMQKAAEHRLRLVPLGDADRLEPPRAPRGPRETAPEVGGAPPPGAPLWQPRA